MTRWARSLAALLRLERRDLQRHRGRTILLLLLVAVPVAAVVGGATLAKIVEPTREEQASRAMGQAAIRIDASIDAESYARMLAALPETVEQAPFFVGQETVRAESRKLRAKVVAIEAENIEAEPSATAAGDARAPIGSGLLHILEGRAPLNAAEVALSPTLLDGLDRSVGDEVTLSFGTRRTITGVVVDAEDRSSPIVLRTPAAMEYRGRNFMLVGRAGSDDLNGSVDDLVRSLEQDSIGVTRRDSFRSDSTVSQLILLLGTIGFAEAGLVIASAFAISFRRRQYEIGLLGATGASPRDILQSLITSTILTALVASFLGALIGIGIAALLHPFLDGWNGRINGPFEVSRASIVVGVLLGVITAGLAAWLPARAATTIPVREALRGRRPATSSHMLTLGLGLVGAVVGFGLLWFSPRTSDPAVSGILVLLGSLLGLIGFGLLSPWILGALAKIAAPLPLPWRLALRDAGRFRTRNGPVVTAILAGMAMSVTVGILVASLESALDALPASYRTDQIHVEGPNAENVARTLATEFSALAWTPIEAAYVGAEPIRVWINGDDSPNRDGWIACGEEELLRTMGAESALEAFREGKLIALFPATDSSSNSRSRSSSSSSSESESGSESRPGSEPRAESGSGSESGPRPGSEPRADSGPEPDSSLSSQSNSTARLRSWLGDERIASLPLHRVETGQNVRSPLYLLSNDVLPSLGLHTGPPLRGTTTPYLLRLGSELDDEQLDEFAKRVAEIGQATVDAALLQIRPLRSSYTFVYLLCLATGLVILFVSTALSSAESANDSHLLHTIGGSPRLLQTLAAARSGYLALLGCLLAVPAGIYPAVGLLQASNLPMELTIPWKNVAITMVGLPLAAFAITWLFSGSRSLVSGWGRISQSAQVLFLSSAVATGTLGTSFAAGGAGGAGAAAGAEAAAGAAGAGAAGAAGAVGAETGATDASTIQWEAYTGRTPGGRPVEGKLGRFLVPENRSRPDSPSIELAFVHFETSHPDPLPPIFFLAGGPGAPGVEFASIVASHPQIRLLEHRDVIGLDQRGTGLSQPHLAGDSGPEFFEEIPLGEAVTRASYIAAFNTAAAKCRDHWEGAGVELSAYNSQESAKDLEDLRKILGFEQIALWGSSYGSHLGLAYLQDHCDHVERALLLNVEGPDHTWKLPGETQQQLETLARRIESAPAWKDSLTDVLGLVEHLLQELEANPVVLKLAEPNLGNVAVAVGAFDLQVYLARSLSEVRTRLSIPPALVRMKNGDFRDLAETAEENHRPTPIPMPLAMDCASGGSPERLARLARERSDPGNLLGDAILAPHYPESCRAIASEDIGVWLRQPLNCRTPVLFVTGDLDVRTPPENVDDIISGFSNASHVRVENSGHGSRELMSPEYRELMQRFLRGEAIPAETKIRLPEPRFSPTEPSR